MKPYEIIQECSKKQYDWCYAIAFNSDQTIMVAGCSNIIIFEFNQGQLNQKQILGANTQDKLITTLYFMSQHNQFISGSKCEIGIWRFNDTTQQFYCLQLLKQAHSDQVNRVIMNKNEDLIISCSNDSTIKFWNRKIEWECSQTLTYHASHVWSISLNQSCTQLISCGGDKLIIIYELGLDQKWRKIQRIQPVYYGIRVCYIDDTLIAFQPLQVSKMEIFRLTQLNKQFVKFKEVPVNYDGNCSYYFPMQFNYNKGLLLNRRYDYEFVLEQSINFGTDSVFGAMTDDFQYLVTWGYRTQEFQVRKQK